MKLGIVVYSSDAETVWNAFRLATFALNQKDSVQVFLLAKGDLEWIHAAVSDVVRRFQGFYPEDSEPT